jgi:hypothetical protein
MQLLVGLVLLAPLQCKKISATIRTLESWIYLTKFAFKKSPTILTPQMTIEYDQEKLGAIHSSVVFPRNVRLTLSVYYDEIIQEDGKGYTADNFMTAKNFKQVYKSGMDCQWRDQQARRHGNAFDLTKYVTHMSKTGIGDPQHFPSEWVKMSANSTTKYMWYYASLKTKVDTIKSRYFYLTISNCLQSKKISNIELSSKVSLDPRYVVHNDALVCASSTTFCQGPLNPIRLQMNLTQNHGVMSLSPQEIRTAELSGEEYGLYTCSLILMIIYVPLLMLFFASNYYHKSCWFSKYKKNKGRYLLLILTFVASSHFLSIVLQVSYYEYILNGFIQYMDLRDESTVFGRIPKYPYTLKIASNIVNAFSNSALVLLVVLIAKGKSITRGKISAGGKVKIAIYSSIYISLQLIVIVWKTYMFDPALVLLEWESPPGIVLAMSRVVVLIWFMYSCFVQLKKLHSRKRNFFRQFCCIGTLWLLVIPFLVFLCVVVLDMDALYREQVYFIADNVSMLIGTGLLLVIWIPGVAEKFFFNDKPSSIFGVTSSYNSRNMKKQERKDLLDTALRDAESLKYKMQRMRDDSDDLINLVDKLDYIQQRRATDN